MNTKEILQERGTTHGDFTDNALVAQELKAILEMSVNWDELSSVQREALHMICHKMARIVSGNPNYIDAWKDIAGYAQLVEDRLKLTPGAIDSQVTYITIDDDDILKY